MPKIQMRRDTAANWKSVNPTLLAGEWALETDTRLMKIGDGSTAYNALPYSTAEDSDEWRKPSDWIDIRFGAQDNSIYALVGHKADFSKYNIFPIKANVNNSGTYDIYIDGVKKYSAVASGTATTINWQTLNLESGFDVNYPEALKTHIIRLTPTVSTNHLDYPKFMSSDVSTDDGSGLLWLHFTVDYFMYIPNMCYANGPHDSKILEAVTCTTDTLKCAWTYQAFFRAVSLKTVPVLECMEASTDYQNAFYNAKIKRLEIKNTVQISSNRSQAQNNLPECEEIASTGTYPMHASSFSNCPKLKRIVGNWDHTFGENYNNLFGGNVSMEDMFLDFSDGSQVKRMNIGGTSSVPLPWFKGLLVSASAPFDNTTSPQISVAYTGMNRGALVNLFNSMPYNIGYQVSGSPTIAGGIASGFSSGYVYTSSYPENLSTAGSWEIGIKFLFNNSERRDILLVYRGPGNTNKSIQLEHYGPSKTFTCTLSSNGSTNDILGGSSNVIFSNLTADDVGHWFTIKIFYTGNSYDFYVKKDDGDFSLTKSVVSDKKIFCNSGFIFGYNDKSASEYTDGSIDLNNTYINVSGVPWFRGNAQVSRTIDIRGCTGTADLTQDDKNIVLNKGWELTVA